MDTQPNLKTVRVGKTIQHAKIDGPTVLAQLLTLRMDGSRKPRLEVCWTFKGPMPTAERRAQGDWGLCEPIAPFVLRVLLNHNCTPCIDQFDVVFPMTPEDISRLPTMIHRTKQVHLYASMKKGLGPGRWAGESNSVISQCSQTSPWGYAHNYGSGRNDDNHNMVI